MYTISLFVGSEEGVRNGSLDDLYLAPLGIWRAGQPVVGIQRDLMLQQGIKCGQYTILVA